MPQLDFWGSWDDTLGILAAIAETEQLSFFRDIYYDEPIGEVVVAFDHHEIEHLKRRPSVFLAIEHSQPQFRMAESDANPGKYLIDILSSPTLLSLVLPGSYFANDTTNLAPGMLSCQSKFWDPTTKEVFAPTKEIKHLYSRVAARIKEHSLSYELDQPIWIGRSALNDYLNGDAVIQAFGREWHLRRQK